jgi:NAD(P)-dependent dehydrogenase (short-subunit alcohol dehydrogenase family)
MSVRKLFDLGGRVALVTGGSRGLGLQIAEGLGEMGAKVALTARKKDELDQAQAQLKKLGIESLPVVCDMSDAASIPAMVEKTIAGLGPIDILVNNAGTTWGANMAEHPMDAWKKVIDLNLTAMFATTQEVGRRCMIPRKQGKIINMSSVAGLRAHGSGMTTIAYNTSKAAVLHFTRALAAEWGKYGINVNAICPGFFPSKMSRGLLEVIGDDVIAHTPLGRLGGEEDLKGLAVFFAAEASRHVTGQYIAVDGGASL